MAHSTEHCPACKTDQVVKHGFSQGGKQRYQCKNSSCTKNTFLLKYSYAGYLPETKQAIIEMTLNGSGIRDISRVLGISVNTALSELKKERNLRNINYSLLEKNQYENRVVAIVKVDTAEIDAMWSFVKKKENQRWLWHAIDHETGEVLAYVLGARRDAVFKKLKALLKPFGITHYYTDDWRAYERHLPFQQHTISKSNTQKIERKHLTWRTRIKRLARKTICFSKLDRLHDIVIGLLINRYEFGMAV
jgi:insertion element IS1 protein InsB